MNITILTYGSRGDVQPFLSLSLGLLARGHRVTLAAPARFRSLAEGFAIPFVPLAGEPEDLSRRFNEVGFNSIRLVRELMRHAVEIGADVMRQTEEASKEADLIVHTFAHAVGGHTLARSKNIPDIHIQTFPMFTPTGDYPNITMPDLKLRALNRWTHYFARKVSWWSASFGFEQVRRLQGLPKKKLYFPFDNDPLRPPTPILCAWSPSVLPPSADWADHVHVTGYYFFESSGSYHPSVELQAFLDGGSPPICVSFGSMINRAADKIDQIIRDALQRTGQRGIILSGWGSLHRPSSRNLLYVDAVPHDWLLPFCRMIIHHGGAGTTSAGLQAGIPNIVVPFTADQPFWGARVHVAGAGPRPILVKKLSVDHLTHAIVGADDKVIRERAQTLGRRIRSEQGVAHAITLIESHMSNWRNFKV